MDFVEDYKDLRGHMDNEVDWTNNTDAPYRKDQSRLYVLRRLRSFNIWIFCESVVARAVLCAVANQQPYPHILDICIKLRTF